ncbi:hypothetical protein QOZ95_001008 [Paenibacillus brasilensis]|uniref:Uncharacterized protein n=1 Tax=Paenibacillus brasilensis TaxID=128574 RepID=A0ABU0KTU2_9BACL|nr:hypothetical protein [Paenibacillus brasilensis]
MRKIFFTTVIVFGLFSFILPSVYDAGNITPLNHGMNH